MLQAAILLIGSDTAPCSRSHAFEQVLLGDVLRRVGNVTLALNVLQEIQARRNLSSRPALVMLCSTVGSADRERLISWMRRQKEFAPTPVLVLADECATNKSVEVDSKSYLVRVDDTETLLEVVSKHLPERVTRFSTPSSPA